MNSTNVNALIENVMRQMETHGIAPSTIKKYQTTGFGAILRHCNQFSIVNYSEEFINNFVYQMRQKYESAEMGLGKWQLIRRSGELLKQYHNNGTIDFSQCEKWSFLHNILRIEPTEMDFGDRNNIRALIWRTRNELYKLGISEKTIENYQSYGFDRVLRTHIEQGLSQYSPEIVRRLYDESLKNNDFKNKRTYETKYQIIRKVAALLEEYHKTETLTWNRLSPCALRELSDVFSRLLSGFCDESIRTGIIKETTLSSSKSALRGFLFEFEDVGIYSFENVTLRTISERVTHMSHRYSGGLTAALYRVRVFLKYLYDAGITKQDLSIAIPEFVSPRRSIHIGFSNEEIEILRSAAMESTLLSKRDYAIMTLAAQTGLRACDVANLKRQDVDWHTNELRIVQEKTGRALTLPLPIESGNAVADYLLNERPKCAEPYVFLCGNRPFRKIQNGSMVCIVSRYKCKTGLSNKTVKQQGFHSFRRSFGKQLLEAGTPLDMLGELLGQDDMDSAKPYMAIDENGLKFCALGLAAPAKEGDLL